jgi:hypothetical protein
MYGFCVILSVNKDYLLKRRYPVDLCNGEVWYSLWGTDWIFKYCVDELRLQFPLSLSKCWDGSQIPSCYCMLLMQPSLSKFIKITPWSRATKLVNFQIISTLSNESRNKTLPSLSQVFTTHHPNVFTPILSLSEGRAGIAWVPSNKIFFFPLRYKAPFAFPPEVFSLLLLLYYPFWLSLSLFSFKFIIDLDDRKRITLTSIGYAKTVGRSSYSEIQQCQQGLGANKRAPQF